MSDIRLFNGDVTSTVMGDIFVVDDNDDIIQMAVNNILTKVGENVFHTDIGNNLYNNRVKISDSGLSDVESYCKSAIINNDSRVKQVKSMVATKVDGKSACDISFALETINGDILNSNVTVSIL